MDDYFKFYTLPNVFFTAVGALILWNKMGRTELTVYGLGKIWDMCPINSKVRDVFQIVSFLGLGILIAILFARPSTAVQAFTAGLGWTGLIAHAKAK